MPKINRNLMVILSISLVIGVVLVGGCATSGTETSTQIIENVTPVEASALIQENQNNPDFVIIDVRTPEEFAVGHIENATLIDYYSAAFRFDIDDLDKDKTYFIYCRTGGRSGASLDIMEGLGFSEVYNLSGGIIAWNAQGLPVVTE